jgi:hypothetical protein
MRIQAIAFDLGNTLVEYYQQEGFPPILSDSIRNTYTVLANFASEQLEDAQIIALEENKEQPDGKVVRFKGDLIGCLVLKAKRLRIYGIEHASLSWSRFSSAQASIMTACQHSECCGSRVISWLSYQIHPGEAQVNCGVKNLSVSA